MTKIEWTQRTWNPIVGCSIVSPGCTNCYAQTTAARIESMSRDIKAPPGDPRLMEHYRGLTQRSKAGAVWTGEVRRAPLRTLRLPLDTRRPTTWFVNSMSDLFHEAADLEWILDILLVMAQCPQHEFQVLTKRSARMREVMTDPATCAHIEAALEIIDDPDRAPLVWPLPNLWLGVSAERQKEADERIPDLLATPAAIRFVSAEPLLGPINFKPWFIVGPEGGIDYAYSRTNMIDWVIVGGESGHRARPCYAAHIDDIVRQCRDAGVAVFVKQLGAKPRDGAPEGWVPMRLKHRKGGDMAEWPQRLRIRQMPTDQREDACQLDYV